MRIEQQLSPQEVRDLLDLFDALSAYNEHPQRGQAAAIEMVLRGNGFGDDWREVAEAVGRGDETMVADCDRVFEGDNAAAERCIDAIESAYDQLRTDGVIESAGSESVTVLEDPLLQKWLEARAHDGTLASLPAVSPLGVVWVPDEQDTSPGWHRSGTDGRPYLVIDQGLVFSPERELLEEF